MGRNAQWRLQLQDRQLMAFLTSIHWALAASIWYFANGVLHDIFVLLRHKGGYNRELLRLLMDGHVLMLSGAVLFVCYLMMLNRIQCGGVIGIIVAVFMLMYCLMIFPFLKSIVTMVISLILLVVCIRAVQVFPDIYKIMQAQK
jgi:hypothetical protein